MSYLLCLRGGIRVSWDVLAGAVGYKVYCGSVSGVYDEPHSPVDVGNGLTTIYPADESKSWVFAITGYNAQGVESAYSAEITYP